MVAALDLIVLIPFVLAPLSWAAGSRWSSSPRAIALFGALAQTGLVVWLAQRVSGGATLTGVDLGQGAVGWSLLLDGLSLPFVALTAVIALAAVSASWNVTRKPGAHFALLLVLQSAVSAVFLADSLLLFYVAWEAVLVPMFLLIGGWGSSNARRAAMKFLVFTFAGGAVLLAGVIVAIASTGMTSIAAITRMGGLPVSPGLAFGLLAFGMLVKLPVVPLHTWLPDAHTEAPTAGSIVLAGVLLKMGGYGLIRIALPFAPGALGVASVALSTLGLVGIVWGAATALVQTDLKRLVAYSSVAHMGFVALAIGIHSPASLAAAVVTMVSHGLVTGLLFFLVGALYERAHTRELSRFGGLGAITPKWSVAFVFASLASAGLPGLSGFPGEFVTTLEAFGAYGWWTLLLGLGVALAAAYGLRGVRFTVQGTAGEASRVSDLGLRETVTAVALGVAIVAVGVAPWFVTANLWAVMQTLSTITAGVGQ